MKMPIVFVSHGAPPLLDDASWMAELAAWGRALPRPRAIVALSAHWETRPVGIGATSTLPLVYDFAGFDERYYTLAYPAPGAPEAAASIREALARRAIAFEDHPTRGWDHGVYVPLLAMFPKADVPLVQVSLPYHPSGFDAHGLRQLGEALGPLRHEGVLIMASGFLTHNLRALGERREPAWAHEFDAWCTEALVARDLDALMNFQQRAPAARLAHPRAEHFAPLVVAAAASAAEPHGDDEVTFPIAGFWPMAPAFSRRSVQFGAP